MATLLKKVQPTASLCEKLKNVIIELNKPASLSLRMVELEVEFLLTPTFKQGTHTLFSQSFLDKSVYILSVIQAWGYFIPQMAIMILITSFTGHTKLSTLKLTKVTEFWVPLAAALIGPEQRISRALSSLSRSNSFVEKGKVCNVWFILVLKMLAGLRKIEKQG